MKLTVNTRWVTWALAAVMATLCARAYAAELTLVENGVSRAPIVVYKDAPPRTRAVADELAEYIEKISGARPEVIDGAPQPPPARAIWVGVQPAVKKLFPELDLDFRHPEEILIAANGDHLLIAGRDRWNPDQMTEPGRRFTIHGVQQEYGTINAVYTFLQDSLDVRWLWPGEAGEDLIEQKTIAFEPFVFRYHPQIRQRDSIFRFSALRWAKAPHSGVWTRHQRLQLDTLDVPGGHGFGDWWERFHETHPDYFALQPDGTRSGFPSPGRVKMCQSNPAVWEQWIQEVERQLEENPLRTVFNGSPNDSWHRGHCVCDNCSAWDHPDGEMRGFTWAGKGARHVALSDRHVTFANHLGRKLKERFPDRDYYVMMIAYGHSRPAPIEAVPEDNVIINSVANFFNRSQLADRGSPNGTLHRDQLADWSKIAPHVTWRPNTGAPAGWRNGMPDISLADTINDFKFIADCGVIGIYVDSVWGHWANQGPMYYLMAQLAWNPRQDGWAVLKDYYRRAFGPAAVQMEAYWTSMDALRQAYVAAREADDEVRWVSYYSPERLAKAAAFLDQAEAQAASGPEKYRRRIGFVRGGFDYVRLGLETRRLVKQVEESGGTDTEAIRKAWANWDAVDRVRQEYPYALNWSRLQGGRNLLNADFLPALDPRRRDQTPGKERPEGGDAFGEE